MAREELSENKSLFDNVPVDDKAFPLRNPPPKKPLLEIVGHCPACGSPIYGPKSLDAQQPAGVQRSCSCASAAQRTMPVEGK